MQSDDPQFICPHLAEDVPNRCMSVWFTGKDKELNWVCEGCAKNYPVIPECWLPVTSEWLAKNREKIHWRGICGNPEVRRTHTGLSFANRELEFGDAHGTFVDVRPVIGMPSRWQALSSAGRLLLFSTPDGNVITSVLLEELSFEITAETCLFLCPNNEFAVVAQASGPNATLIEVKTGKTIVQLSRGDYHCENSHFPIAFFQHQKCTYLIAGSDWNRLDVYDPASGKLLSERGPTCYVNNEMPPHYLDYFHGGLCISPDHQFVVDNGWVWHPVGVLRSWNLPAWLHNQWESEDGPTTLDLACREIWDSPVCWIDNSTLAFWGWGDDEWILPAIVLTDVRDGKHLKWFPGPQVRQSGAWPPRRPAESLFFDQYLFAVDDAVGTTVWNIESGECLLTAPEVKPWRYHPDSKEFMEITPTGFRVSTLITPPA